MRNTTKFRRSTGRRYVDHFGSRKTHKRTAQRANRRYNRAVAKTAASR